MDGAGVERIGRLADPQETGGLLEGLGAEARDLHELLSRSEGAVLAAVFDDVPGQLRPEAGDVLEQLLAGGVDLHAHVVDATDDDVVQAALEQRLIHVVLVLPDADRLGIDLDQFGQRVHEPPADGHGAAHRHVLVGELLAGHLRGRIDRCAALVDHDDRNVARELQAADERFGLAAGGAVADRDHLDVKLIAQGDQAGTFRLGPLLALVRIHDVGVP